VVPCPSNLSNVVKPHTQEHLDAARRNRDVARSLRTTSPDWTAVVAFYAALQFLDAYLFEEVTESDKLSHHDRKTYTEELSALRSLQPYYADLYGLSVDARYNPPLRIKPETAQNAMDDLATFEQGICMRLGV